MRGRFTTYLTALALLFVTTGLFAQSVLDEVDELIANKQYKAAFEMLEKNDPDNQFPSFVIKKAELALDYSITNVGFHHFSFANLQGNQTLEQLRSDKDTQYKLYTFKGDAVLDTLIQQYPGKAELKLVLGHYYEMGAKNLGNNWDHGYQGGLKKAMIQYQHAYEDSVFNRQSTYFMGTWYLERDQLMKARELLGLTVALDSSYQPGHYHLSATLLYLNEIDTALVHATKAYELATNEQLKADAAYMAGGALFGMEESDSALFYFEKCLEYQPGHDQCNLYALEIYLEDKDSAAVAQILVPMLNNDYRDFATNEEAILVFMQYGKGELYGDIIYQVMDTLDASTEKRGIIYYYAGYNKAMVGESDMATYYFDISYSTLKAILEPGNEALNYIKYNLDMLQN